MSPFNCIDVSLDCLHSAVACANQTHGFNVPEFIFQQYGLQRQPITCVGY